MGTYSYKLGCTPSVEGEQHMGESAQYTTSR